MDPNRMLTNLLPEARHRAQRKAYFMRLGVVALLFAAALCVIAAIFLLPSYLRVAAKVQAQQSTLSSLKTRLSTANNATVSKQIAAIQDYAKRIAPLAQAPSVNDTLLALLRIPRTGVTLSSIEYQAAAKGSPAQVTLSGVGANRLALQQYQQALQSAPFAASANLPVSAYAKSTKIPFTILITLKS